MPMQWVTFQTADGRLRAGALTDRGVIDLAETEPTLPTSVRGLLAAGPEMARRAAVAATRPDAVRVSGAVLKAPIPDPPKVICIGLNYRDHAAESGAAIPRDPVVFNKFPTAVIGPDENIVLPPVSGKVDFEAELVVVIGRRGRSISVGAAMDYVAGYTIGHDVSARDWQLEKDGKQWLLGKTFDTFAPIGPAIVSADEIADPHALSIELRLNGQTMQNSSTSQFIFRIEQLIAYVSQVVTLEPGDLLFTGTPPGVGFARKPPVFLQPGDVCEITISGLGTLRNRCVAG
jgi:2-keto-4-pentenoate hydratase/2-oxohepta-3-ene-1,7-dioic acid hydratase in catechol pathway